MNFRLTKSTKENDQSLNFWQKEKGKNGYADL